MGCERAGLSEAQTRLCKARPLLGTCSAWAGHPRPAGFSELCMEEKTVRETVRFSLLCAVHSLHTAGPCSLHSRQGFGVLSFPGLKEGLQITGGVSYRCGAMRPGARLISRSLCPLNEESLLNNTPGRGRGRGGES